MRLILTVHHPVVESYENVAVNTALGSGLIDLFKIPPVVGVFSKSATWSNIPPLFIAKEPPTLVAASWVAYGSSVVAGEFVTVSLSSLLFLTNFSIPYFTPVFNY